MSDAMTDAVTAARIARCEMTSARTRGGMSVREHSAILTLELAIEDFLEEVGA